MTLFKSFWTKPTLAAKNAVREPTMVTTNNIEGLFSKKYEQRIIKKTPAVTNVAACIKAETGVGPSIASGNQTCNPIWADLPRAPQKSKNDITLNLSKSNDKKLKDESIAQGTNENAIW